MAVSRLAPARDLDIVVEPLRSGAVMQDAARVALEFLQMNIVLWGPQSTHSTFNRSPSLVPLHACASSRQVVYIGRFAPQSRQSSR